MSFVQEYVVGFMFNRNMTEVALIRKNKPEWQNGLLNGIGGKFKGGETFYEAMQREFDEEAGTICFHWENFCRMLGKNNDGSQFHIEFFYNVGGRLELLESKEEEKIEIVKVNELYKEKTIGNLPWLIQLAIDFGKGKHPPSKVLVNYEN